MPNFLRLLAAAFLSVVALAASANAQPTFSKSFTPDTIGPGSVSTLRFDLANPGSAGARNLAFTDTLPAGVTIATPANVTSTCAGTVSAPAGGATISFAGTGLPGSSSCSITVDVTSATVGSHLNVSGDLTSDLGNSGNATATLTVAGNRPGFTKSFSPATVAFGGRSTLTFTIDNTSNASNALNLAFTDNLPAGMVVASPANRTTSCTNAIVTAAAGGSVISLGSAFPSSAMVAAGSSCTVSVDVLGNAIGELGNTSGELTSTVSGPLVSSGKASAVLTVTFEQVSLTKTFTDDPVQAGDTVTLELTVTNLNRSSSATGISFSDNLGATLTGLEALGPLPSNPCGSGSSLSGTSLLSLTGGNLAPEASCTFSVTLQVPAGAAAGSYPNTTSFVSAVVGGQPFTGNPASDTLFVSEAPTLTKSFSSDTVGAGDAVTLEFTITNNSSTSAATDIAFTDNLDAFMSGVGITTSLPANDVCGAGSTLSLTLLGADRTLVVSGGNLAASSSPCTFSVDLVVPENVGGTFFNTTSELTATIGGAAVTGNAASDELTVVGAPVLTKEFVDDPVEPGDSVTLRFTVTLSEEAGAGATDIAFTDDLTATLSGLTATGLPLADVCGTGSQVSGTTNLSFSGGSLSPGESCSFDVTLDVPATAVPGIHANTTSNVVATVGGVAVTGISARDDLLIAGLTFTKEFTDDPVVPGGTVTLEFTLENTSTTLGATNISFNDFLSDVLPGLAATGLPESDVCGTGSQISGTTTLQFTGGNLAAGTSCTFSVTLQVPASAEPLTYSNTTTNLVASFDGQTVVLDPASDGLIVAPVPLTLTKEFTDDPVGPGDTVTLELTIENLDGSQAASDIAFTDDLDAALAGLASVSGTVSGVCGTGSEISGTDLLSFTGGSLAAGASCTFSVTLSVPATVELGTIATNTTSEVTGTVGGLGVTGDAASDDLVINFVEFTKAFDGPASAGGTVVLTFTIRNLSTAATLADLSFSDDLEAVLSGLAATGLPEFGVCGEGSELSGTSLLILSGASLLPGGSCTFSVELEVPESAEPGDYLNETNNLREGTDAVAGPATATLTVIEVVDSDGDGVLDDVDVCADTVIPEGVPTVRLGVNRFALVDGDGVFDTTPPNGNGPRASFTIDDTAGCSCEQIIDALGLGRGHEKFGCSLGAMRDWVLLVSP